MPEMRDLNRLVVPRIEVHWNDVAYALHYKLYTADAIQDKFKGRACMRFFEDWLSTDHGASAGPKTWLTLLNAIKEVELSASCQRRDFKRFKYLIATIVYVCR